jgi:hypothetical protein
VNEVSVDDRSMTTPASSAISGLPAVAQRLPDGVGGLGDPLPVGGERERLLQLGQGEVVEPDVPAELVPEVLHRLDAADGVEHRLDEVLERQQQRGPEAVRHGAASPGACSRSAG